MAPSSPNTEFLFDFLYLDRDKLASYSAQIFDNGVLTGIRSNLQTGEQVSSQMEAGFRGFFKTGETENGSTIESLEHHFDASWSLPLNVINGLDERGMIHKSLSLARFGQLVLVKGKIQLIDLRMIQDMWGNIGKLNSGTVTKALTAAHKRQQAEEAKAGENLTQLLSKLPHTLQFRMFGGEEQLWATLKHEAMIVNPVDFTFKHGAGIPGEWFCLGLLDAIPDEGADIDFPLGLNDVEQAMLQMMLMVRTQFGRSDSDYGVTPIAIFRKVDPASH